MLEESEDHSHYERLETGLDNHSEASSNCSGRSKEDECRICGDGEISKYDRLISPCSCTGSISKIHVSCLEKWILNRPGRTETRENLVCEICHETYDIQMKRKVKWNWSTLCSHTFWFHAFEIVLLIIVVCCSAFIASQIVPDLYKNGFNGEDTTVLLIGMSSLVVFLIIGLIRLLFRCYRASSLPLVVASDE